MIIRWTITAVIVLSSALCRGQNTYTIPLEKSNSSLAVPEMTERDGVLYVAYRTFDIFRRSDQLQVLAYDLSSHKELRHATFSVPKVQGARVTNGLSLSKDGNMLAYVETNNPSVILLISVKDLSEIRGFNEVPLLHEGDSCGFHGFDGEGLLSFMCIKSDSEKPRFVRMDPVDLKVVSDVTATALKDNIFADLSWDPVARRMWIAGVGGGYRQYLESGDPTTGDDPAVQVPQLEAGAIGLGGSDLLAFFVMVSKGTIVSYKAHRIMTMELPCSPYPYGISNDHEYAGAICRTQPDVSPDAGGDRILSSEFLLVKTSGPTVVWRQKMSMLGAGDRKHFRWASAVIEHRDQKVWIVAPTKSSELAVYEVLVPE